MFTIDLGGKTALVTGGSQGLGLVTAQTLHQAGANVAIGFFPDDSGENRATAERAVAALGARATAIAADDRRWLAEQALAQDLSRPDALRGVLRAFGVGATRERIRAAIAARAQGLPGLLAGQEGDATPSKPFLP